MEHKGLIVAACALAILFFFIVLQKLDRGNDLLSDILTQMEDEAEIAELERESALAEQVAIKAHRAREEAHWRQWGGDRVIPGYQPGYHPGSTGSPNMGTANPNDPTPADTTPKTFAEPDDREEQIIRQKDGPRHTFPEE